MTVISPDVLLGEIVRFCPATLAVFARHNVDLCCEAGLSLDVAAQKHKLDLDEILQELNEAIETQALAR